MLNVCHLWPGLTPMSLDDVEHRVWQQMAISVDEHVKEQEKAAREARPRR